MRKLIVSAAAVAAVMAGGSVAWAECETCPSLPNSKWEWVVIDETPPTVVAGKVYTFSGNHCSTRNGTEETPGATVYGAQNPGNQIVDGKGTVEVGGGDPVVSSTGGNLGNVPYGTEPCVGDLSNGSVIFVANP